MKIFKEDGTRIYRPWDDFTLTFDAKKQSIGDAKNYMNMIAKTLLYYSENVDDKYPLRGMDDSSALKCMSEAFSKFVSDIDNNVDAKHAVQSFTNELGITSSNRRPSYNKSIAFEEVNAERVNSFSWKENDIVVRKMMNKNESNINLTDRQKKMLPDHYDFHKGKSLVEAIGCIAEKYSIKPNTLKSAYLKYRFDHEEWVFQEYKEMVRIKMKEEGQSEEIILSTINELSFKAWQKEERSYAGRRPLFPPLEIIDFPLY